MTMDGKERLYNLLPALYRQVDTSYNQPLRALMAILEGEYQLLENDMGAIYDNWFIETCDLWVIPYIADLLGVRHLQDVKQIPSQRRLVANSIAYRRRKGTMAALEQAIRDATGWYARGVEFTNLLAITQHVSHTEPDRGRTVDVTHLPDIVEKDRPVNTLPHTLDVDNTDQGIYNLDRIGVVLYRLHSFPIRRSFAHPIDGRSGCFTFDSFGRDIHLFNHPLPMVHISQRAKTVNLPLQISRANLAADLHEYRSRYGHLLKNNQPAESQYYGSDRSLYIELPSSMPNIKPSAVVSMDLSQWPAEVSLPAKVIVAVDVELGRIAFVDQKYLPDQTDIDVEQCTIKIEHWPSYLIVNYTYGFSSEVGGGPYTRKVQSRYPEEPHFKVNVALGAEKLLFSTEELNKILHEAVPPKWVPTLHDALEAWNEALKNRTKALEALDTKDKLYKEKFYGEIRILDNGIYNDDVEINLSSGAHLVIRADHGVRPMIGKGGEDQIRVCHDTAGDLDAISQSESHLDLDGLLLNGGLDIGSREQHGAGGKLLITIRHCTICKMEGNQLKPAPVQSKGDVEGLELEIENSILGPLYLPETMANLKVIYSIVDNGSEYAIAADRNGDKPGPFVNLERSTVFGQVHVQKVTASDVIFVGPLRTTAIKTKDQIRHSYVPRGSEKGVESPGSTKPVFIPHPSISGGATPRFTSTHYGDPAYAQLSLDCPREIRGGAVDGSEMGAYHDLFQLQAEENLREILDEYLPLHLNASIYYVT